MNKRIVQMFKERMKADGLTQKDVADRGGLARSTVATFLLGKSNIGLSHLDKLLKAFGISFEGVLAEFLLPGHGTLPDCVDGFLNDPRNEGHVSDDEIRAIFWLARAGYFDESTERDVRDFWLDMKKRANKKEES